MYNPGDLIRSKRELDGAKLYGVVLSVYDNGYLPTYGVHWVSGWPNTGPSWWAADELEKADAIKEKHPCADVGLCGRCLQLGGDCLQKG
jgi:hypothetical protein